MRKGEKKGPNFLGSMVRILKFTYSESSHQIRQLGQNRIFAYFCRAKIVFRLYVQSLSTKSPVTIFRSSKFLTADCKKKFKSWSGCFSFSRATGKLRYLLDSLETCWSHQIGKNKSQPFRISTCWHWRFLPIFISSGKCFHIKNWLCFSLLKQERKELDWRLILSPLFLLMRLLAYQQWGRVTSSAIMALFCHFGSFWTH